MWIKLAAEDYYEFGVCVTLVTPNMKQIQDAGMELRIFGVNFLGDLGGRINPRRTMYQNINYKFHVYPHTYLTYNT